MREVASLLENLSLVSTVTLAEGVGVSFGDKRTIIS
jgi:hypothetical protein